MANPDAFSPQLSIFKYFGKTGVGRAWLKALPTTVDALEARWNVETGALYATGTSGWVAEATLADGRPAVLKVGWPHPEAREEGSALLHWHGVGSVELYQEDRDSWALLMERCIPGIPLSATPLAPAEAITIAAAVLRSLWRVEPPAGAPFDRLSDVTSDWAKLVRSRMDEVHPPYDAGLVEMGASLLESLPLAAERNVLIHGDFNPGNILSTDRQGWAAIDAKPMIGDPAFDPAPLLMQIDPPFEQPDPGSVLAQRAELLADLVGESSVRVLAWAAARSAEWALWLASEGLPKEGLAELEVVRVAARLAGV